jgi:hypothetical protein
MLLTKSLNFVSDMANRVWQRKVTYTDVKQPVLTETFLMVTLSLHVPIICNHITVHKNHSDTDTQPRRNPIKTGVIIL